MKKEDFYTLPKASEGVEFPLERDGKPSGHWLRIRGTDSEQFRKARFDGSRKLRDLPADISDWDRGIVMDEVVLDSLVSLVADWSFDEPCTPAAVHDFLKNAPQIAESVDRAANDRTRFFGESSKS
ncbi:hypothetical protein HBO32_30715 [Pseudomonas nitroreducens]|uniref:hypothetical protein n=1 Tax=Pseudomonas nitroreducens TaxID=46680 RepID=UPI001474A0F2|nr:hypothetical protein [Pseudomonas nitroreducens]MDG9855594.1 hypothetical protein [Pseudomonas nitroreducens]NMZ77472.1 hypothetical protein [Pseudomonas nitroreducens]